MSNIIAINYLQILTLHKCRSTIITLTNRVNCQIPTIITNSYYYYNELFTY